jgi:hypothetical protein
MLGVPHHATVLDDRDGLKFVVSATQQDSHDRITLSTKLRSLLHSGKTKSTAPLPHLRNHSLPTPLPLQTFTLNVSQSDPKNPVFPMKTAINDLILGCTAADKITGSSLIQSLWSGYGEIRRVHLSGCDTPSVIVKHVQPPTQTNQPRGWNTDRSHQRKLRSYLVESNWYRDWAKRLNGPPSKPCRVAKPYATESNGDEHLFVLEDLDEAGFSERFGSLDFTQVRSGLRWLADFHATFLTESPTDLWPTGTYWHLATRPDELAEMPDDEPLRVNAELIDRRLSECRYQTIVHGDAKVANFCFSAIDDSVAAVDFQYAGGGCGMKDVAYYLGSCLGESQCKTHADELLDFYFDALRSAIGETGRDIEAELVESEWRSLYSLAWADFNRFLLGWHPQHHKLHGYSRHVTNIALGIITDDG